MAKLVIYSTKTTGGKSRRRDSRPAFQRSLPPAPFHLLRRGNRASKGGGKLLRGIERDLDRRARGGAEVMVHKIDRDRFVQQGVVRVVVRHHGGREREPAALALA